MSNPTASSGFQTALSQVFPWKDNDTILVTDSVACDGRFVLYTAVASALTAEALSEKDTFVLWMGCTSILEGSVLNSLKKMGCEKTVLSSAILMDQVPGFSSSLSEQLGSDQEGERLTICSFHSFLESSLRAKSCELTTETLLKDLFQLVLLWRKKLQGTSSVLWVILDDVSALASLIGMRSAYAFLLSLQTLKCREEDNGMKKFGLMVRCANDYDLELVGLSPASTQDNSDWLDHTGSDSYYGNSIRRSNDIIPWERAIVEFANAIVDVTPLSNGFSREVHGRLSFRVRSPDAASYTYNYCLTENQVLVMRVTSQN